MSYRDLRNFTEILRSLGYRRLISLENFRSPNFALVAEILVWLVKRFHPEYDISADCNSSEHRILLLRSVAEFMILKANLKINMKKLYQADGHAVKEMLKIAALLYDALKVDQQTTDEYVLASSIDLSTKIQELKLTRELSSQIIRKGSLLFDLLNKEPVLREVRQTRSNYLLDVNEVEAVIKNMMSNTEKNIQDVKQQIENISSTENSLDIKLGKKENDLERLKKRLETLKKVRPAFLEEFEQLQTELNNLYEEYVIRFRCITYFEQQLQNLHQVEDEQIIANNIMDNMEQDENNYRDAQYDEISPPPGAASPTTIVNKSFDNNNTIVNSPKKKIHGRLKTATERGTMYGNSLEDDSEIGDDDDDEDDDGDDDLDDDDDDDDDEDDEDDDDDDIANEIGNDDLLDDVDDSLLRNRRRSELDATDTAVVGGNRQTDNKSDDEF